MAVVSVTVLTAEIRPTTRSVDTKLAVAEQSAFWSPAAYAPPLP
jgi:hypothetical protein